MKDVIIDLIILCFDANFIDTIKLENNLQKATVDELRDEYWQRFCYEVYISSDLRSIINNDFTSLSEAFNGDNDESR